MSDDLTGPPLPRSDHQGTHEDGDAPEPRRSLLDSDPDYHPAFSAVEGSAYPEPPPAYELSPAAPDSNPDWSVNDLRPRRRPNYQPLSVTELQPSQPARPADAAYPEPPPSYEHDRAMGEPLREVAPGPSMAAAAVPIPASAGPSAPISGGPPPRPPLPPVAPVAGSHSHPSEGAPARRRGLNTPLVVGLVILGLALLCGLAYYLLHVDGRSIKAGGSLNSSATGLQYSNPHEHLSFIAPGTWSNYPTSTAQVMVRGDGCSFGLLEQRTLLSANSLADAEAKDMHRRHPDASPVVTARSIAGRDALTFSGSYTDAEGGAMTQTYVLIDRGSTMVTLIETSTAATCAPAFSAVEESLRL